ncbi:MAG: sterol desaturase family protein [Myxococcota bacterium]
MDTSILVDMALYGLDILLTSFPRYFLVTGGAFLLFWVLLRDRIAHRRIQARASQRKKIIFDVRRSIIGLLAVASITTLASALQPLGLMKLYDDPSTYGWGYFVFSIALLIVGQDAYIYWTHRWIHHKAVFRRVHAVHHRSSSPNPFTSYSVNWLEGMIHGAYLPLMALCLPLHLWAVAVFLMFMMLMNTYLHLGYELLPQGFARHPVTRWLTTSTYHNLHHQRSRCNYAPYFTWWDRLLGTIHPDYVTIYERVTAEPLLPEPTPSDLSPAHSFHGVA